MSLGTILLIVLILAGVAGLGIFWWLTTPAVVAPASLAAYTPNVTNGLAVFNAGGVGMIITGGIPPNAEAGSGSKLTTPEEAQSHRLITEAVHAADPDVKICMQILHTGALARNPQCRNGAPCSPRRVTTSSAPGGW